MTICPRKEEGANVLRTIEDLDIKYVLLMAAHNAWVEFEEEKKFSKGKKIVEFRIEEQKKLSKGKKIAKVEDEKQLSKGKYIVEDLESLTDDSDNSHAKKSWEEYGTDYQYDESSKCFSSLASSSKCRINLLGQKIYAGNREYHNEKQHKDASVKRTRKLPRKGCSNRSSRKEEVASVAPQQQQILPLVYMHYINNMGGSNEKFILEKKMTITDANKRHDRLLIPFKSLKAEFLEESEKQFLEDRVEIGCACMKVTVIQPSLEECEISLRQWNLGKKNNKCYKCLVLNSGWYALTQRNNIEENDTIQLWAFRNRESKPCFALVNLGKYM